MIKQNLISQVVKCVNRFSVQNLPMGLIELSEKDLQHIIGGNYSLDELSYDAGGCCCNPPPPPPPSPGCP